MISKFFSRNPRSGGESAWSEGLQQKHHWDFKTLPTPEALAISPPGNLLPLPAPMRYSSLSCQALLLSAVSRASGCQRQDFILGSLRPYRKPKMFIYVSYCLAKSVCALKISRSLKADPCIIVAQKFTWYFKKLNTFPKQQCLFGSQLFYINCLAMKCFLLRR